MLGGDGRIGSHGVEINPPCELQGRRLFPCMQACESDLHVDAGRERLAALRLQHDDTGEVLWQRGLRSEHRVGVGPFVKEQEELAQHLPTQGVQGVGSVQRQPGYDAVLGVLKLHPQRLQAGHDGWAHCAGHATVLQAIALASACKDARDYIVLVHKLLGLGARAAC